MRGVGLGIHEVLHRVVVVGHNQLLAFQQHFRGLVELATRAIRVAVAGYLQRAAQAQENSRATISWFASASWSNFYQTVLYLVVC